MKSREGRVETGRDVENCPLKWMRSHGRCSRGPGDPQCSALIARLMLDSLRREIVRSATALRDRVREIRGIRAEL